MGFHCLPLNQTYWLFWLSPTDPSPFFPHRPSSPFIAAALFQEASSPFPASVLSCVPTRVAFLDKILYAVPFLPPWGMKEDFKL